MRAGGRKSERFCGAARAPLKLSDTMGPRTQAHSLFEVVAAIIHLGDVEFCEHGAQGTSIDRLIDPFTDPSGICALRVVAVGCIARSDPRIRLWARLTRNSLRSAFQGITRVPSSSKEGLPPKHDNEEGRDCGVCVSEGSACLGHATRLLGVPDLTAGLCVRLVKTGGEALTVRCPSPIFSWESVGC